MGLATTQELHDLHGEVCKKLKSRLKAEDTSAADLTAAMKFLKDNNIEQRALPGSPMASLLESLPFAGTGEENYQ